MFKKATILLLLFLLSIILQPVNFTPANANGIITIKADGSIDPPTAPIFTTDNTTYTFTDNIFNNSILIERNNIIIDGNSCTLQGKNIGSGIDLTTRTNVTIRNTEIRQYEFGIKLYQSSNISIFENNITDNKWYGIYLYSSHNNKISSNNISKNYFNTYLWSNSNYNKISKNNITDSNFSGVYLWSSSNSNNISENTIANNQYGIYILTSSNNSVFENYIMENVAGIQLLDSPNNRIYHNNIINNILQAYTNGLGSTWDNGYPSGGNHWSDYAGTDQYKGSNQKQTGSDKIGDTPYIIDSNNQDRYPLMRQWPFMICDLNSDERIDMEDIYIVAQAFGTSPRHPRWNPVADVNLDRSIDMYDLYIICRYFGRTYI